MTTSEELTQQAREKEQEALELHEAAREKKREELAALPIEERLVYAASSRCPCGAGMAYDTLHAHENPMHGHWDCSAILLGTAKPGDGVTHSDKLPFAFWEIKSEDTPSAHGMTTRPEKA